MNYNFRIAVIGDFMVDEWWWAESMKICPDAPVPDLINPVLVKRSAGGAGNVARNLLSLGAKCSLYGIIGRDDAGYAIWNELLEAGADWEVEPVEGFETHRKIRYCSNGQMVFRVSKDRCRATGVEDDIIRQFDIAKRGKREPWNAIIVADYNKGLLMPYVITRVMDSGLPVFVDPKFDNTSLYKGAELIKFNKAEALAAMREWPDKITYSIARLQEEYDANNIVVTLGHVGMEVIDREGEIYDIPGREVAVADVTGAGDTAIAVLTLEYLRTGELARQRGERSSLAGDLVKSAFLANYASSLVVQKRMTAVVTCAELEEALGDE